MKAALLVSHGSRLAKTKEEISTLTNFLRQRLPEMIIEYAFLEIESPSIPQGIDRCAERGASEVVVVLNFLNTGRHVEQDVPDIIRSAEKKYPHIKFAISKPIGQHSAIGNLFVDLINEAIFSR